MKKKKIGIIAIIILLICLISIKFTYSKLNLSFYSSLSFISKEYKPLSITKTAQMEDNVYQITIKNDNNYEVIFSCENDSFEVECNENIISANASENFIVYLDFKDGVAESTLTPNPNGSGYITKVGIRITSPYEYPKTDPHYIYSDNMVVTKYTITNFADYITTSASTDTTNFAIDHSNVRYIGAYPNNYITFNNELWRILGVFDGKLKIMRTSSYNNPAGVYYDGDANGTNTKFQNSKLKTELNNAFYVTISSRFRSMIKEGTWNVGGLNTWEWQTPDTAYTTEKSTTTSANVGLINATDYVYATGGSNRTTCIGSLGSVDACSAENWLYPYATTMGMWTINEFTALSGYSLVVNSSGSIAAIELKYPSHAYPVVYLDENIGFTSGDGTQSKPYKIKSNTSPIVSNNYRDYITNVYLNTWENELSGFAGREINSFDKTGGALLFANETWGIPSEYTMDQVTVYSFGGEELTTYFQRTWEEDNVWHARLSNYVFKRQVAPDLDYIGASALEQYKGSLRFVIIVKN